MQGSTAKKWLKLTFPCPTRIVEPVSDLVGVLSGTGVEIRPLPDSDKELVSGFFALNEAPGGRTEVAAEAVRQDVTAEIEKLFAIYNLILTPPAAEIFDDQDWATSWQQFFTAGEIIPGLAIRPSWEKYSPPPGVKVLTMDPGMAFGTGQHASTRLALSLLATCFAGEGASSRKALDIGTGTGILAMAASLYGADQVMAIDNDPLAVRIASHNVIANHLDWNIGVSDKPLADITGFFDLICANIVHDVLAEMADDIRRLLRPGGNVILAGILRGDQENSIGNIYGSRGFTIAAVEHQEEWAAFLLRAN